MRIYTCPACIAGNHEKCEGESLVAPGQYGGSRCVCGCNGKKPTPQKFFRHERLNRGLLTLSSWCQSRTMLHHDVDTTLTMLGRKVEELREAVRKAGQIDTP